MWKSYFSQLLNVNNANDIKQADIHTTEPLVSGPSVLEVEFAIAMLKSITIQVVIKFQQNCIKHVVKHKCL
jgi:hypothetical protein